MAERVLTAEGRRAVAEAFDALNRAATAIPAGHGKGRTLLCSICGTTNGDPHSPSCPIGVALAAISPLMPAFADREQWFRDG